MKQVLNLIIVASIIVSCNKIIDDPEDNPTSVLAESDIGSSGGTLEADGISLTIPPEALASQVTIQILPGEESDENFGDNAVTNRYQIAGIPEDFSKPIEIRLSYTGSLANENYLAVGSEVDMIEFENSVISFALYEASDSAGHLVSFIEPQDNSSSTKASSKKSTGGEAVTLNLMGITNMKSHDSQFFKVTHPLTANKQNIITLADHMDAAMDTFHDMKLFDKEAALVIMKEEGKPRVTILEVNPEENQWLFLEMPKLGPFTDFTDPALGLMRWTKMLRIKFNASQILFDDFSEQELKSIAYVWVYRMLYFTYFGDQMDWFAIASMYWIKEKYGGVVSYKYDKFSEDGLSPFLGMEKGIEKYDDPKVYFTKQGGKYSLRELNHALSMLPLIKYLDKAYPNDRELFWRIISETLKANSKTPTEGIINAIGDPEYIWWPGFFKDFMTKQLYDIPKDKFIETVDPENHLLFHSEIDTTFLNDSIYADLSATLYRINFVFDEFKEDARLNLKLGPSSLNFDYVAAMAFGEKDGSLEYFDHSSDLTITDLAALKQNGYQSIVVAVINSGNEPPFNETRGISLDTRLVITPADFNWATFKVKARANFNYNDGSSSEGSYTYADAKLRSGEMVHNTFFATWSEPFSDGTSSGTLEIVFDPERFPSYISSYSITETQKLSDTRTYTITGEDIELWGYKENDGSYTYYVSGEGSKDYITSLNEAYAGSGGYGFTTDETPITDGSSYIEIRIGTQ